MLVLDLRLFHDLRTCNALKGTTFNTVLIRFMYRITHFTNKKLKIYILHLYIFLLYHVKNIEELIQE